MKRIFAIVTALFVGVLFLGINFAPVTMRSANGRILYSDYALAQIPSIQKASVNDYQCIPNPGNPPTGNVRFYCDSSSGNINCITSGGTSCLGSAGFVNSVFGRAGVVTAQSGDYSVSQVTGAAPTANPTFTGVQTLPSITGSFTQLNSIGSASATFTGTGTCGVNAGPVGGSSYGYLRVNSCTTATLTITTGNTASHEYYCSAYNQITTANVLVFYSTSTTTCVFTMATAATNDIIVYQAMPF